MALTRGPFSIHQDLPDLLSTDLRVFTRAELSDGLRYAIDSIDGGENNELANGLFANPITTTDPQTAINTASISSLNTDVNNLKGLNPNNQAGAVYELALVDADHGEVWMSNASPNVVTIPLNATTALPAQTYLVNQEGAGVTSIQAVAGVTLNGIDGGFADISAQYSGAAVTKRADNAWVITGAIGAVS